MREGHWHKKHSNGSLGAPVSLRPTPTFPFQTASRLANNPSITKYLGR